MGTKCDKCGEIIPNGQWFHTDIVYNEFGEIAGFTNDLCAECAGQEGKELNTIV